jgi:hypothetical protein
MVCKPGIPDVEPKDLCEYYALAEAKAGAGKQIMGSQNDEPRLVDRHGPGPWIKMQHIHYCPDGRKLVIHYFHSLTTFQNVELKFVPGKDHPGLPGITDPVLPRIIDG